MAAISTDKIYIYTPIMARLHSINLVSDTYTWTDLSHLPRKPTPRKLASVFSVGYNLFVMGGMPAEDDQTDISSSAMYVLRTFADPVYIPQWANVSKLPDEPLPLVQATAVGLGSNIWLLGGRPSLSHYPGHVMIRLDTDPQPDISCPRGFQRDPPPLGVCVDIDECLITDPKHNCHANAMCYNVLGSFTCSCMKGYHTVTEAAACPGDQVYVGEASTSPGQECVDIDECSHAHDPERKRCNYFTYMDEVPPFVAFPHTVQVLCLCVHPWWIMRMCCEHC
jgi:hypothetical protein